MAGVVRWLEDLSGKGADLLIQCKACGHDRTVPVHQALDIFRRLDFYHMPFEIDGRRTNFRGDERMLARDVAGFNFTSSEINGATIRQPITGACSS